MAFNLAFAWMTPIWLIHYKNKGSQLQDKARNYIHCSIICSEQVRFHIIADVYAKNTSTIKSWNKHSIKSIKYDSKGN